MVLKLLHAHEDRYPLDGALPEGSSGEPVIHMSPDQINAGLGRLAFHANTAGEQAMAEEETSVFPEVWYS